MIKVHGVCPSPFVRKVLACLELKGLNYDRIDVFPINMPDEYKQLSPLSKIPALEDGDFTVSDSSVICEYLNEKYPDVNLMPTTAEDRAKARWIEEYADSKLAELASGIFFERVLKALMQKEPDEARIEKIVQQKLPEQYPYLESIVPPQGFLFGDTIMVADIALTSHFINASYAGYEIDEQLAPKFKAYYDRVTTSTVIAKRMKEDQEFFAQHAG